MKDRLARVGILTLTLAVFLALAFMFASCGSDISSAEKPKEKSIPVNVNTLDDRLNKSQEYCGYREASITSIDANDDYILIYCGENEKWKLVSIH